MNESKFINLTQIPHVKFKFIQGSTKRIGDNG